MADHSTCTSPQCGAWADGYVETCPRCGAPMKGQRGVTWGGWVALGSGLFLLLLMGTITVLTAPMLLRPGVENDGGAEFTGTPQQAFIVLGIFGLVLLFGLAATIQGAIQVTTGKQSQTFVVVILALAGVMLFGSLLAMLAL